MLDISSIADTVPLMASDLLTDIRAFLDRTGMGASYFGKLACGNSELVDRLQEGKTVTLVTADKVRAFMKSARPSRSPHPKGAKA